MTTSPAAPDAKELSLVNNVEMKFALADSDAKFERVVGIYLAPLLLKLESQHTSVRNKVIAVCQHVNTRVKAPTLKLPVAALLEQYKGHTNQLIRHFDLLYISQGIERLPVKDRLALIPILIKGLSDNDKSSPKQTALIFNIFLRLLHHFTFPERGTPQDAELRRQLGLDQNVEDAVCISRLVGKLILLAPRVDSSGRCPGLRKDDVDFLNLHGKQDVWDPNRGGLHLTETKVRTLKFIASGAFADSEKLEPALLASADRNSRLVEVAEDILKRTLPVTSLEDETLIASLLAVYLGDPYATGALPASLSLRIKILNLLCKSRCVSSFMPQSVEVIIQGLLLADSTDLTVAKPSLESSRLLSQVFTFTEWLVRKSPQANLKGEIPRLHDALVAHIRRQGWPIPSDNSEAKLSILQLQSRSIAYETIGLLIASSAWSDDESRLDDRGPSSKSGSVGWLFDSLSCDPSGVEISTSIEQALSSVLASLRHAANQESMDGLVRLLVDHSRNRVGETVNLHYDEYRVEAQVVRSTRSFAVRFANRSLPFQSVSARWIDISAIDVGPSESQGLIDEGRRGLDPFWHQSMTNEIGAPDTELKFPEFSLLVDTFFGERTKIVHDAALESAVTFAQSVLVRQALVQQLQFSVKVESSWDRNLEISINTDEVKRRAFSEYLRQMTDNEAFREGLSRYLEACLYGLKGSAQTVSGRCGQVLLNVLSLCPQEIPKQLAAHAASLPHIDSTTDLSLMTIRSEVFGILMFYDPEKLDSDEMKELHKLIDDWQAIRTSNGARVCCAVLALSFCESRVLLRIKVDERRNQSQKHLLDTITAILWTSKDKTTKMVAATALGELSLFGVVPETTDLHEGVIDDERAIWQKDTLTSLYDLAKSGIEPAIYTLGFLASRCGIPSAEKDKESALTYLLDLLHDLHEVRQPEIHFAVGAAMSTAAMGWQSKSLIAKLDVDARTPKFDENRLDYLSAVMDKILVACTNTKPALRQASVIWLLCLVQYCGYHELVQARLRQCQEAFKSFLADRDSLNQESAARGLSLCYEKGDRGLKDDLVRDLVTSFTGTKKSDFGKITGDTELFEPGALPTGDGQSITTYKDIMSLASEVGDPSLVYRFMSLATNNSIWSSRAAFGRFGLSTILSDSSVDGYLAENPKLYSALFRYRFDPNQNVRNSMNDIWTALVKNPAAVISVHFDTILHDLLKNILGKEWRTRQASCAAIANLLQGQKFEIYERYLADIWMSALKISDDIKESVQLAGLDLCKTLTGILTRSLQAASSPVSISSIQDSPSEAPASRQLKVVFSFIFSPTGIESRSEIVQSFSLWALLEIIKASNPITLRPFVPDIVGHLLGLLSASEPMVANYLRQRADQHGTTAQDVDDARLRLIRDSPLTEAIERSLDTIDADSMKAVAQSVEEAMKTVVGLPSKVGTSRVLVSLSTRHNFAFKPFANRFLKLATKQLLDINDTVSAAFATACGYLARLASDQEILQLVKHCQRLYFESDDERHRAVAGDTIHAISKRATDRFNGLSAAILPLIFIAKHDLNARTKSSFRSTWDESVGGSRSVLLYFSEIMSLISPQLSSPRWSVKHTSSLAAADAISVAGDGLSDANAKIAWPVLEEALKPKTWDGKEVVLHSFINYVKNSEALADEALAGQVRKIMIREAKRNNAEYRVHALACLAEFSILDVKEDHFSQVSQIVGPLLTEDKDEDSEAMDVDSKSGGPSTKSVSELTSINAAQALLASINPHCEVRPGAHLISALETSQKMLDQIMTSRASQKTQTSVLEAIGHLLERLQAGSAKSDDVQQTLVAYVDLIFMPGVQRIEQTRSKAAEVARNLADMTVPSGSRELRTTLVSALQRARHEERSVPVQKKLEHAMKGVNG